MIVTQEHLSNETIAECVKNAGKCFVCHNALRRPFVLWSAGDKAIALHPKCAVYLAAQILMDAHKCKSQTKPFITTKTDDRHSPSHNPAPI